MAQTKIQTKMILLIGTNGTGKTTLLNNLINSVNVPRKLIVTRHESEFENYKHNDLKTADDLRFTGVNWHLVRRPKETFARLQYFTNGILALDDARRYLKAQTDDEILDLYISRRQNAVHIIIAGHGFTQIPPQAFTFATDIFLFATRDNIDSTRKNTVQNYEELVATQKHVNQQAQTNWHYYKQIKY